MNFDVSQLTLDEHEELVHQLTESLLTRKMCYFISIISDTSQCLSSRLTALESMLKFMIDHFDFFEKFPHFVERTPSKMQQIREELSGRSSELVQELLVRVENLYEEKKSLTKNKV